MESNIQVYLSGFLTGVVLLVAILILSQGSQPTFYKVSEMPKQNCKPGISVLYTSVSPVEYYTCETHWVKH